MTGLSSAQGQGRAVSLSLFSGLLMYSLIHITAASRAPRILNSNDTTVSAKEGQSLIIRCEAKTRWPRLHNIYWLVNQTFIEDAYPDGRVTEKKEKTEDINHIVQTLEFKTMLKDDNRTFTCVVQDPSGSCIQDFHLKVIRKTLNPATE